MKADSPFFSVVIPLYNKEKHIKGTIESVLSQTFQDFEIVVVNDGSKDYGANIVEELGDDRIRVIHQDNAGVSAARNKGIKESNAAYIVLLDADDFWLLNHLENMVKLITIFPFAGLYATAYKIRNIESKESDIKIYGLEKGKSKLLIPNYFESIANGDSLVCASSVCIPKRIFEDNNIWFPVGEKYGEDQYVWARVAVQYEIAYCKNPSAIYDHCTENNTIAAIQGELEPHKSFYMIKELRELIKDKEKLSGFDKYISKIFHAFPYRNIIYRSKLYGLKQALKMDLSFKHKAKLLTFLIIPRKILPLLKNIKRKIL